ncbi:MAG: cell division protein ZapA [Ignavibacteria bacterium]|nr:cell division protein ZapA [Ignavibacteria bacterium]
MNQKEIRVKIFNSEYNLQGENTEKVERVSDYVDGIMNRINSESPNQPEETIAVVSALNIAEEYFKEKDMKTEVEKEYSALLNECETKIKSISDIIDENLYFEIKFFRSLHKVYQVFKKTAQTIVKHYIKPTGLTIWEESSFKMLITGLIRIYPEFTDVV